MLDKTKTLLRFFASLAFSVLLLVGCECDDPTNEVNKSIQLDGDGDYLNLGNIYDDLSLPFSVSAWVNIDPNVPYTFPILVSQDNSSIYNGFWFCINKTHLYVEFGDGKGNNNGLYKNGKTASIGDLTGKWIYVTTTVRGANDIDLFVNGINVGGDWTGSSISPMDSNFPDEDTHVGTVMQNGSRYFFKGNIDDLTVWNRSLSSDEVYTFMHHSFKGDEEGLIGHWNFDEDSGNNVLDKSTHQYNGTLQGDAQLIESVIPGH